MIYCVEDDDAIRDMIVYTMKISGFEAKGFESDATFWPAIKEQLPELVLPRRQRESICFPGKCGHCAASERHRNRDTGG